MPPLRQSENKSTSAKLTPAKQKNNPDDMGKSAKSISLTSIRSGSIIYNSFSCFSIFYNPDQGLMSTFLFIIITTLSLYNCIMFLICLCSKHWVRFVPKHPVEEFMDWSRSIWFECYKYIYNGNHEFININEFRN